MAKYYAKLPFSVRRKIVKVRRARNWLEKTDRVGKLLFGGLGAAISTGIAFEFPAPLPQKILFIAGTSLGAAKTASFGSHSVMKGRTEELGKELKTVCRSNPRLRMFISAYKYIYVNRHGQVVGSNWNFPSVYTIRLKSKDILSH